MKDEKLEIGREYADVEQLKALLAAEIVKTIERDKLTVRAAHAAADFSRIRNADLARLSSPPQEIRTRFIHSTDLEKGDGRLEPPDGPVLEKGQLPRWLRDDSPAQGIRRTVRRRQIADYEQLWHQSTMGIEGWNCAWL